MEVRLFSTGEARIIHRDTATCIAPQGELLDYEESDGYWKSYDSALCEFLRIARGSGRITTVVYSSDERETHSFKIDFKLNHRVNRSTNKWHNIRFHPGSQLVPESPESAKELSHLNTEEVGVLPDNVELGNVIDGMQVNIQEEMKQHVDMRLMNGKNSIMKDESYLDDSLCVQMHNLLQQLELKSGDIEKVQNIPIGAGGYAEVYIGKYNGEIVVAKSCTSNLKLNTGAAGNQSQASEKSLKCLIGKEQHQQDKAIAIPAATQVVPAAFLFAEQPPSSSSKSVADKPSPMTVLHNQRHSQGITIPQPPKDSPKAQAMCSTQPTPRPNAPLAKVSPAQHLTASGGQSVQLYPREGRWQAQVTECIGYVHRQVVLPVVCAPDYKVTALMHYETGRVAQLLHVAKQGLAEFVYVGRRGLLGGMLPGEGAPEYKAREASPHTSPRGTFTHQESSLALQQRMEQGDIQSTEALLAALNDTQDPEEQQALQRWVEVYIKWFNSQPVDNFTLKPETVQEYSALAHIQPSIPAYKKLLDGYFDSVWHKAQESRYNTEALLQALAYTLQHIDPQVFNGDPERLLQLSKQLLERLDSTKCFLRAPYPTYRSLLYALHQALVIIHQIAPDRLSTTKKNGLYQRFKKQLKAIADAAQYYPFVYHSLVLQQSLQRLASHQPREKLERLGQGLLGSLYLTQGIAASLSLSLDVNALRSGYECFQKVRDYGCIKKGKWYEQLQAMHRASILSLTETDSSQFYEGLQVIQAASINNPEEQKALRFGILLELNTLALQVDTPVICQKAFNALKELARLWADDPDLVEAMLDGFAVIATQGVQMDAAEDALEGLINNSDFVTRVHSKKYLPWLKFSPRHRPIEANPIQVATKHWLGGQQLEEKLSTLRATSETSTRGCSSRKLFRVINSIVRESARPAMVVPEAGSSIPPPLAIESAREDLQKHCQQYSHVTPLLGGQAIPVHSLQCQLMVLEKVKAKEKASDQEAAQPASRGAENQLAQHQEQLKLVKNPIALEALFNDRSVVEGEPVKAIQRILLTGEAGTGKTTLSRKLTYLWAQGQWGQEFQMVYLLPIRALQQSQYDSLNYRREETLATAIVNNCFADKEEKTFKQLRQQVSASLEQPNTLVLLDGLDERYGASESLISQALAGKHKLLILSRPYGIEQERPLVELSIEHAGFNDLQMEQYVKEHVPSIREAAALLGFLQGQPAMHQVAHVPVNLEILCALWQDDAAAVRQESKGGSLLGLYRKLTEYIWNRYADSRGTIGLAPADRVDVFTMLGKIAFRGLKRGQVLISGETVREVIEEHPNGKALLQESGLLLAAVGRQYQFPHLTFQEYFTGKKLAEDLLSQEDNRRAKAIEFLGAHKYQRQYRVTLTFLAGEISRVQGVAGLHKLLEVLHEEPQEVVGVQHLLLQLQCVNEWLCLQEKGWERDRDWTALEEKLYRTSALDGWFAQGLERVRKNGDDALLTLLTDALQGMRSVVQGSPATLQSLLQAVGDSDWRVRKAAVSALGQLGAAAPTLQPLLQAVGDPDWSVRDAAVTVLGQLAAAVPSLAPSTLQPLLTAAGDSDTRVRKAAASALGPVVGAAPSMATLEQLVTAAGDSNWNVCYAAVSVLGQLAAAAPSLARATLQPLLMAVGDSDKSVHHAAVCALVQVVGVAPSLAPDTLQLLLQAAQDNKSYVRQAAIFALGQLIGAAPSLAPATLQQLLTAAGDSESYVCNAAFSALRQLGAAAPSLAPDTLQPLLQAAQDSKSYIRNAAISALGQLIGAVPSLAPDALQPLLQAAGDRDSYVHKAAVSALMKLAAVAPSLVTLEQLLTAAGDSNESIRYAAVSALGQLIGASPTLAPDTLRQLLMTTGDSDWNVRSATVFALSRLVEAAPSLAPDTLQPLLQAVGDSGWSVRMAAVYALGQLAAAAPSLAPDTLQPLLTAAGDSDWSVRQATVCALVQVAAAAPSLASDTLQPLLQAVGDSNESVRNAAFSALRQLAAAAPSLATLERLLQAVGDSSGSIRYAAVSALGQLIGAAPSLPPDTLQLLLQAAGDRDSDVRKAAVSALGKLAAVAPSLATMERLLQAARNSSSDIRQAAVYALVQVAAAAPSLASCTLERLLQTMGDRDSEACKAAIKVLGQLSLMQLIEGYLATGDKRLIPIIVSQLLHTPLVILSSRTGYRRLVLYPTAGEPVKLGERLQEEVQPFVMLLKNAFNLG